MTDLMESLRNAHFVAAVGDIDPEAKKTVYPRDHSSETADNFFTCRY